MALEENRWNRMTQDQRDGWVCAALGDADAGYFYRSMSWQELPEQITEKLIANYKD